MAARGHEVHALRIAKAPNTTTWKGGVVHSYNPQRGSSKEIHPWLIDLETKVIRGEAAWRKATELKKAGIEPDVIYAHPGWGESLFLKEVWPHAKLVLFGEFYYAAEGADSSFDPEFPPSIANEEWCRLQTKNLNQLAQFQLADIAISPTHWQAGRYPMPWRDRIQVVHDGIDTAALRPDPHVKAKLADGCELTRDHEVITFVARHLEPYRGFHIFMRALPALLRARPKAHVLVVGEDGVSYGQPPPAHRNWREYMLAEMGSQISTEGARRVHFVGRLQRDAFTRVLQLSAVHIYLTYPFVLSWSLLEAMSVGCAIVASDTAPVREVIDDEEQGLLVNFFDADQLVRSVDRLLEDSDFRGRLGLHARDRIQERYDLRRTCLPRQLKLIETAAVGALGDVPSALHA